MRMIFTFCCCLVFSLSFGQASPASPEKVTRIGLHCAATVISNTPLYIIDGERLDTSHIKTLNPESIKSITVLRGNEAVAIWGSLGANGVILITTKDMLTVSIKDKVTGEVIQGATIRVKPIDSDEEPDHFIANENGEFKSAAFKPNVSYTIAVSSVGYQSMVDSFSFNNSKQLSFNLDRDIRVNDAVTVTGNGKWYIHCGRRSAVCIDFLSSYERDEKPLNKVKVYPNPVQRGKATNLEILADRDSDQRLRLLSVDGREIYSRSAFLFKGTNRITLPVEASWPAGVYFVQLVTADRRAQQPTKILIQ